MKNKTSLLLLLTVCILAQVHAYTISGDVTINGGNPCTTAKVELWDSPTGGALLKTTCMTDNYMYRFNDLASDTYYVFVKAASACLGTTTVPKYASTARVRVIISGSNIS